MLAGCGTCTVVLAILVWFVVEEISFATRFSDPNGWPKAKTFFGSYSSPNFWRYGLVDAGGDVDGDGVRDLIVAFGEYFSVVENGQDSAIAVFSGADGSLLWSERADSRALGAAGVEFVGGERNSVLVGSMWEVIPKSARVILRTELRDGLTGSVLSSREDRRASPDDESKNMRPLLAYSKGYGSASSGAIVIAEVRDESRSYTAGALAIVEPHDLGEPSWLTSTEVERHFIEGVDPLDETKLLIDANESCLILEDGEFRDVQVAAIAQSSSFPENFESGESLRANLLYVRDTWYGVGDLDRDGAPEVVSISFRHDRDESGTPSRDGIGWAELWSLDDDKLRLRIVIAEWSNQWGFPRFVEGIPDLDEDGVRDLVLGYRGGLVMISGAEGHELMRLESPGGMSLFGATSVEDFNGDGHPDLAVTALPHLDELPGDRMSVARVYIYSIARLEALPLKELSILGE